MKVSKEKIAKLARESLLHHDDYTAAKERTLKSNAKVAAYNKLYWDGYRKALIDVPLESFTDLVEENGEMIPRKNHRNFKAGYKAGLEKKKAELENMKNNKTR